MDSYSLSMPWTIVFTMDSSHTMDNCMAIVHVMDNYPYHGQLSRPCSFKYFLCICLLASIFQINKVAFFFYITHFIIIKLVSRLCPRIVFVIGAIPGLNLWSTGICCDTLFQKEKERFVLEVYFNICLPILSQKHK